jgi:hypothetical protein
LRVAIPMLDEKRQRFELALGIVLICAMIVHDREAARALFGT